MTPTFVYRALKGLPLVLDNDGVASRDFIHVDDIVRGLIACAERGAPGDVYNLASGEQTTVRRLAELVLELSGSTSELQIGPRRSWDHSIMRFGSAEKAREALGFEAQVSIEDGLRRTIDWTREELDLIDSCIGKHAELLQQVR